MRNDLDSFLEAQLPVNTNDEAGSCDCAPCTATALREDVMTRGFRQIGVPNLGVI